MTIHIELRPEEERDLQERARACGHDLAGYVGLVLQDHLRESGLRGGQVEPTDGNRPTPGELLDLEAIASCAKEADDLITLEEVRHATSTIKDSMARVVIEEERAERF